MVILQARILEWVDTPSSRGSSKPRDWTQVSCIAGGFFTIEPGIWITLISLRLEKLTILLANFLFQVGWVIVSRYLVKYVHVSVRSFGDLHLNWWTFGKADCLPYADGPLLKESQSAEGLSRTNDWPPMRERHFCSRLHLDLSCTFFLSLKLVGLPYQILILPSIHNCVSQLFRINLFLHICTSYWFSSLENSHILPKIKVICSLW